MLRAMDTTGASPSSEANPYPYLREVLLAVDDALKGFLVKYAQVLPPSLITMGKMALAAPGKVMPWRLALEHGQDTPIPKWPLFAILAYLAALPPEERQQLDIWREAIPAAVAVELASAAADLIDEIADNDPSPVTEEYGIEQALNTANLMLVMSQQVLLWQARGGNSRAILALGALQDMLVEAAVGQHLDMAYEKMGIRDVTPDMSGEMSEKKAGALMGGACRMGALMSGAGEEVVELVTQFGRQLGFMAQLANDIQDALPQTTPAPTETDRATGDTGEATSRATTQPKPKTDLRQRKRTLPIVYALREESEELNPVQAAFSQPAKQSEDEEALRRAVVAAGGVEFAQMALDLYGGYAAETLEALEALRPGARRVLSPLFSIEASNE